MSAPTGGWGLAIDFGTTATAAAIRDPDGQITVVPMNSGATTLPSSVFAQGSELLVGELADNQAHYDLKCYQPTPKRCTGRTEVLLGDHEFRPAQLVGAVLADVIGRAMSRRNRQPPSALVLTHPVMWDSDRRGVLADAVQLAADRLNLSALPAPTFVAEPVAAANWYVAGESWWAKQDPPRVGDCIGVYDLGGGTFDAAVLRRTDSGYDVLAKGGIDVCGGYDFDNELFEYLGRSYIYPVDRKFWKALSNPVAADPDIAEKRRSLLHLVKQIKEQLTVHLQRSVKLPLVRDLVLVTQNDYEELIRESIGDTIAAFSDTVEAAGVSLDELHAIYRIGGAARTPAVGYALGQLHRPVRDVDDPKLVVALGAALDAKPSGHTHVDRAQQLLEHAQFEQRAGKAAAAIADYQQILALDDPESSPHAGFALGELHRELGETDLADGAYRRALDSGHHHWAPLARGALDNLARQREQRGAPQDLHHGQHQEPVPDRAQEWLAYAEAHQRSGRQREAIYGYQWVVSMGHRELSPRAGYALGELYRFLNRSDLAEAEYRRVVDSGHDYWAPLAITALSQVKLDRPRSAQAWYYLAKTQLRIGNQTSAIHGYRRVIALEHPELSPRAGFELAELHRSRNETELATAEYRRVIATHHEHWAAQATAALNHAAPELDDDTVAAASQRLWEWAEYKEAHRDIAGAIADCRSIIALRHPEWSPTATRKLAQLQRRRLQMVAGVEPIIKGWGWLQQRLGSGKAPKSRPPK